jgi:molybdate transport system substrate-binding protein
MREPARLLAALLGLAFAAQFAQPAAHARGRDVIIFAAASLKNALDDVVAGWEKETGKRTRVSYAASNTLALQIEAGAPADIFFSADLGWMNYLSDRKLIRAESRSEVLSNRLALIAPRDSRLLLTPAPGFKLKDALGDGHLAMANVDAVPAGKYGKEALEKLQVWGDVADRVAQADNVRAALLLVARGEAPLGIVYHTDAVSEPAVKVLGLLPENTHPPVVYSIAQMAETSSVEARTFLEYVTSSAARPLFEKHGFTFINKRSSSL